MVGVAIDGYEAVDVNNVIEEAEDDTVEICRSLLCPLIPLFEFLNCSEKYSHSSFSLAVNESPSK